MNICFSQFWCCSKCLFCMLAEYITLYLSQFELLVQKGRFSSLLFCLLSYRAGLIMLIGLNSVKNPMFGLRLYSQNIPFCSSLPLYLCTDSLWSKSDWIPKTASENLEINITALGYHIGWVTVLHFLPRCSIQNWNVALAQHKCKNRCNKYVKYNHHNIIFCFTIKWI